MKSNRYGIIIGIFTALLVLMGSADVWGQTPGQIFKPATGSGRLVLDPNGDGYVSAANTGFSNTSVDYGAASEIGYHALPLLFSEIEGDPTTGGSHTDLFGLPGQDPGAYIYSTGNSGTDNLLFRIRLIDQSTAAKGYSFLFDTNSDGIPDKEVVMRTGGGQAGISVYDENGIVGTIIDLESHFQKSLAGIHDAAGDGAPLDQTYFYDWYVPWNLMPAGLQPGTSFKAAAITVTSAVGGYLTGGTLGDVGGMKDSNYPTDEVILKALYDSSPEATGGGLGDGGGFTAPITSTPSIIAPVYDDNTSVSGTSIEENGTVIVLYNGSNQVISTGTVTVTNNTWTATVDPVNLVAGDKIYATATATGKSVSGQSTKVTVLAAGTTLQCTPAPINFTNSGNAFIGTTPGLPIPTLQSELIIRLYENNGGSVGVLLHSTSAVDEANNPAINLVAFATSGQTPGFSQNTTTGDVAWRIDSGQAGGNPYNVAAGFFVTAQVSGYCESDFSFDGASIQTTAPIITTTTIPVSAGTQQISGTSQEADGTTITIYRNDDNTVIGTATVSGGTWTATISAVSIDDQIYARATNSFGIDSARSNIVVVGLDDTDPPVVTGQYVNGSTGPITGYTLEGGALVRVFVDGTYIGETTSNAFGVWSLAFANANISSLATGQVITADAQVGGKNRSLISNSVTVLAGTTSPPTIYGGDTSRLLSAMGSEIAVTGSGTIRIYIDGVEVLETTAASPISYTTVIGTQTLGDLIEAGVQIYATRQTAGNTESLPSNILTVLPDPVRYITVTDITPDPAPGGGGEAVTITYQVLNSSFAPASGVTMVFSESSLGSITAVNGTAIDNNPSYLTNASGLITVTYTTVFAEDGLTFTVSAIDNPALATSLAVTVNVGIPSSIAVTPSNPTISVGGSQQFVATATYPGGKTLVVTDAVTWTSGTEANATINSSTGLASGVAVGTSVITATLGSVSGNTTLTVENSSATQLTFNSPNDIVAGGTSAAYTVTRRDAGNNAVSPASDQIVYLFATGTGGTFYDAETNGNAITSVTIASGASSANFWFTSNTAGAYTLTGSDATPADDAAGLADASDAINVTAGAISVAGTGSLLSGTDLSRVADGVEAATISVQLKDVNGNNISQENVVVTFATTLGTLSSATANTNSSGVASVTLTSTTSGTAEVTAEITTPATGAVTNGSPVEVTFGTGAAVASQSTLTPTSATITADGSSTQVLVVQPKDAQGNNVTDSNLTVTITRSSGTGEIGSVSYDAGTGTYRATVTSPTSVGSGVFVATLGGQPVQSGSDPAVQTQATISYVAGGATQFIVTLPGETFSAGANSGTPSDQVAGTQFTVELRAVDANGNLDPNYDGSKTISWSGAANAPDGTTPSYTTSISFTDGVATTTINTTLYKAETGITLTATQTGDEALTGQSATFDVSAAASYKLLIADISSPQLKNIPFDVTVSLTDTYENPVINTGAAATITLSGSGGVEAGNLRRAGVPLVDANPTETLAIGESSVVFSNVLYTGLSDVPGNDVQISGSAAGSGALANGATGQSNLFSVRGIILSVLANPTQITANGTSTSAVTVTLTDADSNPLQGVTVTVSTDAGTLLNGSTELSGATGIATDANGQIALTLRSSTTIETATILAQCPGACPAEETVEFVAGGATTIAMYDGVNTNNQSATVGTAVANDPAVIVTDANGNPVSGVSVTFAVASGGGTVDPTTAFTTNAQGIATVTSWTLGTTAGTNTLTATSTGLTGSPVTFTATGTPGAAAQLVFGQQPTNAVSGASLDPAVTVRIEDQYGNLTTSTATVYLTIGTNPGSGTLSGDVDVAAVSGVATFSDLSIDKAGTGYTLVASDNSGSPDGTTGLDDATSSGFNITSGMATTIAMYDGANTNNQSATVGMAVANDPAVIVTDANGNPVSGVSVTFVVASGGGTVDPTDAITTDANGIATATNWTLGTTAGTNTLSATSGTLTGSPVTFTATGTPGAATKYIVTTSTTSPIVGADVTITAQLVDQYDNPVATSGQTVTWTKSDTNGSFATPTSTTDANGQATIVFTSHTVAGTSTTVTATTGSISGTSETITTRADGATQFIVTLPGETFTNGAGNSGTASDQTAGVQFAVELRAVDANGNTDPNFDGTKTVTWSGAANAPGGNAPIYTTSIEFTDGFATTILNTTLFAAESNVQLTANQDGGEDLSGQSNTFDVLPAAISASVSDVVATSPVVAGQNSTVTITLRDQYGNLLGGKTDGDVTLTLTGDATEVASSFNETSTGVYTINITNQTAETITVTATVSSVELSDKPEVSFTPGPVSASNSSVTVDPSTLAVNANSTVTITLRDAFNNVITGLDLNDITVGLTGDATIVANSLTEVGNGVYTAETTNATAEVVTVTVTADSVELDDNPTITFEDAPVVSVVEPNGAIITAGTLNVTIDAPGQLVTELAANKDVTWSISGGANQGLFTATPDAGTGNVSITFTNASVASLTPYVVEVTAEDAFGNTTVTTINVTVNDPNPPVVSIEEPDNADFDANAGTLAVTVIAPTQFVADLSADKQVTWSVSGGADQSLFEISASGVITFKDPSVIAASPYVVEVTAEDAFGNTTVITVSVTVTPGTATTIAINAGNNQSATVGTAVAVDPSVIVTDANGNPVAGVSVTFAVASGEGTVVPETTVTTDANGIATATSWTLGTSAGTNTLTATSGTLSGSPLTFTATGTPGAATQLVITTQPVGGISGSPLSTQPVVQIQDQYGNLVDDDATEVTVAIFSGDGGTLGGTFTVTANNGVATFSGLTLAGTVGEDYVLRFTSDPVFTPADSDNVNVTSGTPTTIAINAGNNQSATVGTAVAVAPSVIVTDANGNPVGNVSVTFAVASGGGHATGTTVITNAQGIATVGSWTLGTITGTNTLTATSTGLSGSPLTFTATGTPGAPHTIALTGPGGVVVGQTSSNFTIKVVDQYGNTTNVSSTTVFNLSTSDEPSSATFSPTSVSIPAGQSTATFTYSNTEVGDGSHTITATRQSGDALPGGTSDTHNIAVSRPFSLSLSTITATPISIQANGVSTSIVTVQLKDSNDNDLTNSAGTVSLSTTLGTLSDVIDNEDGTYTAILTSSFTAGNALITGSIDGANFVDNATVAFTPVAATAFVVTLPGETFSQGTGNTGTATTQTAGEAFAVQLRAVGANNTVDVNYNGTKTIVWSGPANAINGSQPIYTTTVTFVNGVATTTLNTTLVAAESGVQLTATQSGGENLSGTSNEFDVNPGDISSSISSVTATTPVTAGLSSTVTISLRDAYGNTISDVAESEFAIQLSGNATTVSGSFNELGNGLYELDVTDQTAETITVTATVSSVELSDKPEVTFTPGPVSASNSTVTVDPSVLAVNANSTVTITLRDAFNNVITGMDLSDITIVLSGDATIVANSLTEVGNGVYTAEITNATAEVVTVTVTADGVELDDEPTITFEGAPIVSVVEPDDVTISGGTLNVTIDAPAQFVTELASNKDVTWSISGGANQGLFTVTPDAGTGNVSITFTSTSVASLTPYVVEVTAEDAFGNTTVIIVNVTVIQPCSLEASTARIAGRVINVDANNAPLQNVMMTLIPQGSTPGTIQIQITGADGSYDFSNLAPGRYIVQVQDENLNIVSELYPVNSSLYFSSDLTGCSDIEHDFPYGASDLPVLAGMVWYDVNGDGLTNEWYDANNDGEVTQNFPDENGVYDTNNWEWIDINGNGTYNQRVDIGELNRAGFGNDKSGNIRISGPNTYRTRDVIVGVQGNWRTRPGSENFETFTNPWGEYTIELRQDEFLRAASERIAATGLVKVLGSSGSTAKTASSGGFAVMTSTDFVNCSSATSSKTVTLSPENPTSMTIDLGVACFTAEDAPVITLLGPDDATQSNDQIAVTIAAPEQSVVSLGADKDVTWSISGGDNETLFEISSTGVITFKEASIVAATPYVVEVTAVDAFGNTSTVTVNVTVVEPDTEVTVPDGTVFELTTITIKILDDEGNPIPGLKEKLVVSMTGSNEDEELTEIIDNGDGTYTISYVPKVVGTDFFTVTLEGVELPGGPFESNVGPGPASADNTTANVPNGLAGVPTTVTITVRDEYGNLITGQAENLDLAVVGGPNEGADFTNIIDNGDGTYTATYTPTGAGTDQIEVRLNGDAIDGSPYNSIVGIGAPVADNTTAVVPNGTAGVPSEITITVRDGEGNLVPGAAGLLGVNIGGANDGAPVTAIIDNGDGTYTVRYTPTVTGTDQVNITLGGNPISDSPFPSVVTSGAISASNSSVIASPSTLPVAGTSTVTITLRDANNNPINGLTEDEIITSLTGDASVVPGSFVSLGNGVYTVGVTNNEIEQNTVTVTARGVELDDNPVITFTVGPPVAQNSTASVPGGFVGQPTTIVITLRDQFNNPVPGAADQLSLAVSGANGGTPFTNIIDNGDGTYTVSYTPTQGGEDEIAINLNGEPISGSPYPSTVIDQLAIGAQNLPAWTENEPGYSTQLTVTGGTGPYTWTVVGNRQLPPGLTLDPVTGEITGTPTQNGTYTFTVEVEDENGNTVTREFTIIIREAEVELVYSLVFTQSPNDITEAGNQIGTIVVEIQDQFGALNTDYNGLVSIDITEGTGGPFAEDAVLIGTTEVFAVNGVATYPGIIMERAGEDYTLTATATDILDGISDAFTVTPGPPWRLDVRELAEADTDEFGNPLKSGSAQTSSTTHLEGNRIPMIMTIFDEFGNRTGVPEGDTPVLLVTSSVTGQFFRNQTETTPVDRIIIPVGQPSAIFYYEDPTPGELVIDGTPQPPPGAREISPDDAPLVIRMPASLRSLPEAYTTQIFKIEPVVVSLRSEDGVAVRAPNPGVIVTLESSSSTGVFYSDPEGTNVITETTILPAESSSRIYYADITLGTHTLTFTGAGVPDPTDETLVTIIHGPAVAANSLIVVPDGFVGEQTVSVLTLFDELGNPVFDAADQIAVSIVEGPNAGFDFTIVDNGDGTYNLIYTPLTPGVDMVSVVINGTEMPQSPLPSRVRDSEPFRLVKISGDEQTVHVLGTSNEGLKTQALGRFDNPVENANIRYTIIGTPSGAAQMSMDPAEVRSGADGFAQSLFNAGTKVGAYQVMAYIPQVDTVYFNMNVIPCIPTFGTDDPCGPYTYEVTSNNYTPDVNGTVAVLAQLTDRFGNATHHAGVEVTWSTNNQGRFSAPTSMTNDRGIATISYTVNNIVGSIHNVTATDAYTQTGTSPDIIPQGGGLAFFKIVGPDSVKVGVTGGPYELILMDEFENEIIANRNISFQLSMDQGENFEVFTMGQSTNLSRAGGNIITVQDRASRSRFYFKQNKTGQKLVTGSVLDDIGIPDSTKSVLFYNEPGDAQILTLVAGQGQKERILNQLAERLTVTVIDQYDNPIPNLDVTFTLTGTPQGARRMNMTGSSTASKSFGDNEINSIEDVAPVTMTTDSLGRAGVVFYLGDKAGSYYVEATGQGLNTVEFEVEALPGQYTLYQNYPNPFNAGTKIMYEVPVDSDVTITLYNAIGQRVATLVQENRATGVYTIDLDMNRLGLTSGVYIYHMSAFGAETGSQYVKTQKLLYVK